MWKDYFIILIILIIVISWFVNDHKIAIYGSGSDVIKWNNNLVYTHDEIIDIVEKIENNIIGFQPISKKEHLLLKKMTNKKLTIEQLTSMRNMIATQKNINAKKKSYKFINNIINDSKNIKNIPDFFNKYPLPPMEIIRIMKQHGSYIDSKILDYAINNDSETAHTYKTILVNSEKFENDLINYIKTNYPKIKFKTQNMLVDEQVNQFGKAVLTPDILFDEPILFKVDGYSQLVRWIDAKNYTLINIPFIISSIEKQAEKYTKHYGPGALIFHHGVSDIRIKDTLILDASFI